MALTYNLNRGRNASPRSEEDFMPTAAQGPPDPESLRDKISGLFGAPEVT